MSLWREDDAWKTIRKAYRIMRGMNAGFRTQFVQAAYAECWIAFKLAQAGYDVKFHEGKCDLSVELHDSKEHHIVNFEIKHSMDKKDPDRQGHGYSSWVISKPQVEEKKFHLCVLVRDSLTNEEPDAAYVFSLKEIATTEPIDVNAPRKDYYLWYSTNFKEIKKDHKWMRGAANPLVESLNRNPFEFTERWENILSGNLHLVLKDVS